MSGILKIINFNPVWEGNLEAISDFFCGSGHVIPKHILTAAILSDIILTLQIVEI